MAIYRGTGGASDSTDDSTISAVTVQAGIATTKASEAASSAAEASTSATNAAASAAAASGHASTSSDNATASSGSVTDAAGFATAASDSATEASNSATAAETSATLANSTAVQAVAAKTTEITGVYNDIANVNTVAGNIADVNTVATNSSNITAVAGDASDIGTVAGSITNVNTVGDNIASVNTVASNNTNINTVAADASDIGTVAGISSNVTTVAGISSDVTTVAGLEPKLDTVIADAADIGTVAGNIGDVSTVAGISGDVDTVAGISADVTSVADNMTAVQNATTSATNAASSAASASDSASAAATSAGAANSSASSASTSETNSANSSLAASNSATAASASKNAAASSAASAGTSATNAAASAVSASASSVSASNSETAAAGSAGTALLKATESAASAVESADSATDSSNAASTWSNYYNTYVGASSSEPTVDVQGNALVAGALYFNTTNNTTYVWTGSAWNAVANNNIINPNVALTQDLATNGNDVKFGDNDKATFGASDDLQIFHNGANSYIQNVTNSLIIQNDSNDKQVIIKSDNGSGGVADYFRANGTTGEAILYHYGSPKLTTTATGIDVIGFVNTDGIIHTGDTDTYIKFIDNRIYGNVGNIRVLDFETSSSKISSADSVFLQTGTTALNRLKVNQNGDISFYEDTGTTPKLFWDASAESLGIGTSSPQQNLHVSSTSGTKALFERTGSTGAYIGLKDSSGSLVYLGDNNGTFEVQTAGSSYSTKLAVTSVGNVGIGTSSPTFATGTGLQVTSGSFASVRVNHSGSTGLDVSQAGGGAGYLYLRDNADLIFGTNNAERMRIDSAGNVGIGTSSPAKTLSVAGNLQVDSGAANSDVSFIADDGYDVYLGFGTAADRYASHIRKDLGPTKQLTISAETTLSLKTNNTERMRIDSAGNLLVGKTATGTGTVGAELRANGFNAFVRSGGEVMNINRLSSDGTIVDFRKDSSTVGSIGAGGGDLNIGTGDTRIRFNDATDNLIPLNAGNGYRDASISLGDSGARFKDLYLSGGVYLGGTGAANKLDDYEEGTWTPVLAGIGSGTINQQYGRYTKVGNLVHVTGKLGWTGATGTAAVSISGLPFAAGESSDSTQRNSAYPAGDWQNIDYLMNNNGQFRTGGSSLIGVVDNGNGSSIIMACTTHIGSYGEFNFNVTYRA